MSDARSGIAAAAINQPFVTDRLVALDQPPEEALQLGMLIDQRIEVASLADHDFAANDRLDSVLCRSAPRQDPFAGEAQRNDLSAARRVRLEFGQYARPDE